MTFVPVETLEQVIEVALPESGKVETVENWNSKSRSERLSSRAASLAAAIVFYVSGHGFGHASRTIEVINAVLARRPETRIGVRTSAPRWLFDLTVKGKVAFSTLECDTGVVQIDALTLDEADTIRRASAFHSDLVTRAASETRVLRELGAGLIVGDIPPLAFAVSAASGIPSIGLGNFTWDWIYADYPRVRLAPSLLPAIRGAYAKASMALRLPMSAGFETFSNVKDIPFIARHATRTREEVCKILKTPVRQADRADLVRRIRPARPRHRRPRQVQEIHGRGTANVPVGRTRKETPTAERKGSFININEEAMYDAGVRYEDLVGAAEAVVTKPGYGIISECIANDAAVLYTSRGHFPEYDVLVEDMPKYLRTAFISQEELFAGKWEPHLDKLLAQSRPRNYKKPETNGADVAAEILLKALDKPPKKPRGRPQGEVLAALGVRGPVRALRLESFDARSCHHQRPDPRTVHLLDLTRLAGPPRPRNACRSRSALKPT